MPLSDEALAMEAEPPVEKGMMDALFGGPKAPEKARKAPEAAKVAPEPEKAPTAPENEVPEPSDELAPEDLPDEEVLEPEPEAPEPVKLDDEAELEVTVDGEVQRVKIKDLKLNYSGEKAIASRIQAASEARNSAQQHAAWLYEANQAALARLEQLDQNLAQFAEPQVNWEWLRANQPQEYLAKKEQQLLAKERQAALKAEQDKIQQNQSYLNQQATERYLEDQAEALRAKLPELSDPNKARSLMASIKATISDYGYTEEELRGVTDHRVLVALRDLALLKQLRSKKVALKTEAPKPSTMLRAGSSTSNTPSASAKQRTQAIINKARQTGHHDDVAEFLVATSPRAQRR